MKRSIKNVEGMFGQIIYYEDGVRIGESWPGLIKGSYNHYDADGSYQGRSAPGLFGNQVHYNEYGRYAGETHTGLFGQKVHCSADRGYVGETWDGFGGETTSLMEEAKTSDPFASYGRRASRVEYASYEETACDEATDPYDKPDVFGDDDELDFYADPYGGDDW